MGKRIGMALGRKNSWRFIVPATFIHCPDL